MKAGERKIKFDKSFVDRVVFHVRNQLFVAFSSLQAWGPFLERPGNLTGP